MTPRTLSGRIARLAALCQLLNRSPLPLRPRHRPFLEKLEDRLTPAIATWTGGGNDFWTDPNNWVRNGISAAPQANDDLVFPDNGLDKTTLANNFPFATQFRSFTFNGQGYFITGNIMALTNGISANNFSGTNTIALIIGLNGNQTINSGSPEATLTFASPLSLGASVVTVSGSGTTNFDGAVDGLSTAQIVKEGTGRANFTSSNVAYSGAFVINNGELRVTHNNALGNTTGATFVNPGGTLFLEAVTTGERLHTAGAGFAGNGAVFANANATLTNMITLVSTSSFGVANGVTLTTTNQISAATPAPGLTKVGTGTMQFTGMNTYTGSTTIDGGTVLLSGIGTLSQSTSIVINPGAILTLDNTTASADRLFDTAALTLNAGTFNFIGRSGAVVNEMLGTITLASGHNTYNATSFTSSFLILQAEELIRSGAGTTIQFNPGTGPALGTNSVTQGNQITLTTGPTLSADGILPYALVNAATPNPTFATFGANGIAGSAPTAFADGTNNTAVAARLTNTTAITSDTTIGSLVAFGSAATNVTISTGVTLTLATGALLGTSNNLGINFTGPGVLRLLSPAAHNEAFLFSQTGTATLSLGNTITSDNSLTQGLTFAGPNPLTLVGPTPNTYKGTTRVNAGTLILNKSASVIAVPGDLIVGDGSGPTGLDQVTVNAFGNLLAVSDPTIMTVTTPAFSSGGNMVAGTYGLVYTFVTQNGGETLPKSPREIFTVATTGDIPQVANIPAFPAGVTAVKLYLTQPDDSSGALVFYGSFSTTPIDLMAAVPASGAAPPTLNTAFADVTVKGGGTLLLPNAGGTTIIRNLTMQSGNNTGVAGNTQGNALVNSQISSLFPIGTVNVLAPAITAVLFAGQSTIAGTLTLAQAGPATRTFTIADGTAVNDAIIAALITAPVSNIDLVKNGPGTLLFSGNNAYTGSTFVTDGILVVNGNPATNSSAFFIDNGGQVSGGVTTTAATIGPAMFEGTVNPGQVPGPNGFAGVPNLGAGTRGILRVNGPSQFLAGSNLVLKVTGFATAGIDFDQLNVVSSLIVDPGTTLTIDLSNLTTVFDPSTAAAALKYTGRTGRFSNVQVINNPANYAVVLVYEATQMNIFVKPTTVPAPFNMIVVAPAKKRPGTLQVHDAQTQALLYTIKAFNGTSGVEVATGDVNADGILDIIASQGGLIRVFDGTTGLRFPTAIGNFRPFGAAYKGQVYVASGDINNDGTDDIIAGQGTGKALVRAWNSVGFDVIATRIFNKNVFAGATGGVRVASGNSGLGGLGDDIYVAAGAGTPFEIKIFDTSSASPLNPTPIRPYGTAYKKGGFIAVGDIDLDGMDDILVGPGAGAQPVHVVDGVTLTVDPTLSFVPFAAFTGPVRVALADVNGDGRMDAVTTRGTTGRDVTLWDLQAPLGPPVQLVLDTIFAFDAAFNFGLNIAGGSRT